MEKDSDKDIEDVRRAESARGRKRPHYGEARLTRLDQLLKEGTDEEFAQLLIARGWRRGSPEFGEALAAFRSEQQRLRWQP